MDGWPFLKEMPVKKAASSRIRTADMALAATTVTGIAMEFSGCIQLFINRPGRIGPRINHFFERGEADMQAFLVVFGNVIMTRSATFRGIGVGWVTNYTIMGGFPVRIVRIAAMALLTAELAMIFVLCKGAVDIDLFVRSQRLHLSTSSFSFCFGRGSRFVFIGFGDFPCDLYQFTSTCMTGEAVIFPFRGIRSVDREKGEQQNTETSGYGYEKPGELHVVPPYFAFSIACLILGLNLFPFLPYEAQIRQFICQISSMKDNVRNSLNDHEVHSISNPWSLA